MRQLAERQADRHAWMLPVGTVATLLLAWEAGVRAGLISEVFFPAPTTVVVTLVGLLSSGQLLPDLAATLGRTVAGSLIGCVPALAIGLTMGWSPRMRAALDPIIAAIHPLPKIAILPLLMVIFGIGETSKVTTIAIGAFFPMLLSAAAGVRQISPLHFEVVRSYGGSRRKVFTRVVLPGSLPFVLTGLRLSLNVALLIAIAVELVAASNGLGRIIWLAWETLRTEQLYASLVVIAMLGLAFNAALGWLARWLVPWQTTVSA